MQTGSHVSEHVPAKVHDQDHNATLHTIYRTFGDVRSTSDVLQLIETARS
jgi:hypothetical protein